MFRKISGLFIIICSLSILATVPGYAQKLSKAFKDSTRIKERQYRLEAKQSVDSFKRVRKIKNDSIFKKNNPDTIPFRRNVRLGIDISKPITSFFNHEKKEIEFSGDYHFRSRFFLSAELGFQLADINKTGYYSYHSTGEYLRAGFDYSIFRLEKKNDANIVYIGLRLAGANVQYQPSGIQIPSSYFGNTTALLPPASGREFWLEFVAGIKVDISKHLGMGWTLRLASSLNDLTKRDTYPIYIPGFGDSNSSQNFTYNYSIFYSF